MSDRTVDGQSREAEISPLAENAPGGRVSLLSTGYFFCRRCKRLGGTELLSILLEMPQPRHVVAPSSGSVMSENAATAWIIERLEVENTKMEEEMGNIDTCEEDSAGGNSGAPS